jgi:hypothetical protein
VPTEQGVGFSISNARAQRGRTLDVGEHHRHGAFREFRDMRPLR